jgi:outer membrane protein assembly factor BamB
VPIAVSPQQHRSYPNGAVLILEPTVCRVQAIGSGKQLWTRNYPGCGGLLESAIARDSTAFVRAGRELAALGNEGRERWRIKLEGDQIPRAIAAPTTLADSRVVIAESPRAVAVLDADGRPAWRFSVPTEEVLVAPPEGLATEGLALLTGVASYVLGADGELRSRVATTRQ